MGEVEVLPDWVVDAGGKHDLEIDVGIDAVDAEVDGSRVARLDVGSTQHVRPPVVHVGGRKVQLADRVLRAVDQHEGEFLGDRLAGEQAQDDGDKTLKHWMSPLAANIAVYSHAAKESAMRSAIPCGAALGIAMLAA